MIDCLALPRSTGSGAPSRSTGTDYRSDEQRTDDTAPSGPAHILVADDDPVVRATLASSLRSAGFTVTVARSAQEALTKVSADSPPDLALLDIRMPGRDGADGNTDQEEAAEGGIELARHLRDYTSVPFLILSAYSDEAFVDTASKAGALAYLVKPLEPAQLLPAIRAALDRANEIRSLKTSAANLQSALRDREASSIVMGLLMERYGVDRKTAFDLLRAQARRERKKVRALADEVLAAPALLDRMAPAMTPPRPRRASS